MYAIRSYYGLVADPHDDVVVGVGGEPEELELLGVTGEVRERLTDRLSGDGEVGRFGDGVEVGVITSYSIHYTKLYEPSSDCDACHGAGASTRSHAEHSDNKLTVTGAPGVVATGEITAYTVIALGGDGTCTNNCHNVVSGRDWNSYNFV